MGLLDAARPPQGPSVKVGAVGYVDADSTLRNFLTPTSKSSNYTAANKDFVQVSGTTTITLPAPAAAGIVGVAATGVGAVVTVSTPSGNIFSDGVATSSVKLTVRGSSVLLIADGTNYFAVASGGVTGGWLGSGTINVTSPWGATTNPQIRRMASGLVLMRGTLTTLNTSGTQALGLIAGFRPGQTMTFPLATNDPSKLATAAIDTAGVVTITYVAGVTSIMVDSISFLQEN